jgi:folate-binding protein YgfZ
MTPWQEALSRRGASFDGVEISGFGDPAGELGVARDAAVLCDLAPFAALRVAGPDAESFLQGQVTSDVTALDVGTSQYSAWCSPKGRVLASFLLRRSNRETFEMILPAPLHEPIRKRLGMFVLRAKVRLEDSSGTSVRIGVGGPAAAHAVAAIRGSAPALHRSTRVDGGDLFQVNGGRFMAIVAPEQAAKLWDQLATHARPAGFSCWRWLLVRAGVSVILPPTQDQFIPQAINWDAIGGVSFQKGCYTGQEIVARTQYLGRLKERTLLAHIEASAVSPGTRLFSAHFGDQPCGTVLNAAAAPAGGSDLLAVVRIAAAESGELQLGAREGPSLSLLTLPYELPGASGTARVHRSTLSS